MAAYVDARIVKNTYKGGDFFYIVEVGYEDEVASVEGAVENVIRWVEHASISTANKFHTIEAARKYKQALMNEVLESSEVVE